MGEAPQRHRARRSIRWGAPAAGERHRRCDGLPFPVPRLRIATKMTVLVARNVNEERAKQSDLRLSETPYGKYPSRTHKNHENRRFLRNWKALGTKNGLPPVSRYQEMGGRPKVLGTCSARRRLSRSARPRAIRSSCPGRRPDRAARPRARGTGPGSAAGDRRTGPRAGWGAPRS